MKPITISFRKQVVGEKLLPRITISERDITEAIIFPSGEKRIEVGIGEFKKMTRRKMSLLFRRVVVAAKAQKAKKITIDLNDFLFAHLALPVREVAEIAATNFELANFEFVSYKTPPSGGWNFIEEIHLLGALSTDAQEGFRRGQVIGEEVNAARELSNTPGSEMTPALLGEAAKRAASGTKIAVKVLGMKEMEKLGMGGIIGVGKGSDAEPKFIIMEYFAGPKSQKPVVLVGKGITFDTGGLNIKPGMSMEEMHMDMSGGAAVMYALRALARLGIKKNIVALIPAAENMPSGKSYRMHDVLKTMGGKTIEIGHTDAEGRVVLADGLEYAKRYKPELVIDVATLTGAAMVALGQKASALFASDEKLERQFREAGERSGDYVWPLPLWEEYEHMVKGTFGDVTNAGKIRYGGAIEGAVFLWQFIKGYPWVHIDMAPRMSAAEGDHLAKGATGEPVRLLVEALSR